MSNAFVQVFTVQTPPADQAILLGSDYPDLDPGILDLAFDSLSTNGMTLGPAVDGGYYLIGFNCRTFSKEVFDGIPWGTGKVFDETVRKAELAGVKAHVLPEWRDIDTFADLESFYSQANVKRLEHLRTTQYLHTMLGRKQS
jgi:glycosyltransferase A (GT-A) superfamily protein (DUF2064 family)